MSNRAVPSFRSLIAEGHLVRVAGAHSALGGKLAEEAGFQAVWASSFEISAARCLPDASLLTMSDYLVAAVNMQRALTIPVVADCDTGFGNIMNVAHMVREYDAAGITAICMEDKTFPKMNSFVATGHQLIDMREFARKIEVAKSEQLTEEFFLIARTEALIDGLGVDEAVSRARTYREAGADAILVHSKKPSNEEILEFLSRWEGDTPIVVVPTTYPDWHADEAAKAGISVIIYANQGLRATIASLRKTFSSIVQYGDTTRLEPQIASIEEVFALQGLAEWQRLDVW